jgi:hypothetical protein
MSAAQRIGALAEALVGISTAAGDGALVDLTGLEAAVTDALETAQAAPASERPVVRTGLAHLIEELDRLVAALARQHHASAQQRAAAAYARGGPPGPGQSSGTGS